MCVNLSWHSNVFNCHETHEDFWEKCTWSVSLFSTSFARTIYHSGKHSTTSAHSVCRKECRPLCRAIFTTVLSKWQLQQLDEICEAPQYQHLWNNCPIGHSRWSLAILLTIQILLDITLCYWVHSSQHSCYISSWLQFCRLL
jgi:hypothetical protein